MNIRDYDPSKGIACQGDVAIVPVPKSIKINLSDEISSHNGRLILQAGEVTGHHHAIALMERPVAPPKSKVVDKLIADVQAGRIAVPTARMYRDAAAAQAMVRAGILTRADLCVGFLIVEHGPMVVSHEEHDGIRLPIGTFYVGRQIESAGTETRIVAD